MTSARPCASTSAPLERRHPLGQLFAVPLDVEVKARGVRVHHALKQRGQLAEAGAGDFVIAVSLHSKVAFEIRSEVSGLLAARGDKAAGDLLGMVFGLGIPHAECHGLFGLGQYVRDAVAVSSNDDHLGKAARLFGGGRRVDERGQRS